MSPSAFIAALLFLTPLLLAQAPEPTVDVQARLQTIDANTACSARVQALEASMNAMASHLDSLDKRDKTTRLIQGTQLLALGLGTGLLIGAVSAYANKKLGVGGGGA